MWKIYQHSELKKTESVKQGFSWPAFLFTWIWAFVKKLNKLGCIYLFIVIVLRIIDNLPYFKKLDDLNTLNSLTHNEIIMKFSLACLLLIINFIFILYCGFTGNSFREKNLISRGYILIETTEKKPSKTA